MPNLRFAAPKERRVALVTGGARGIGRAAALRIAEEGRDIVIADLLDLGDEVVKEVEALGQRAIYIPTDVTDETAVQALSTRPLPPLDAWIFWFAAQASWVKKPPF